MKRFVKTMGVEGDSVLNMYFDGNEYVTEKRKIVDTIIVKDGIFMEIYETENGYVLEENKYAEVLEIHASNDLESLKKLARNVAGIELSLTDSNSYKPKNNVKQLLANTVEENVFASKNFNSKRKKEKRSEKINTMVTNYQFKQELEQFDDKFMDVLEKLNIGTVKLKEIYTQCKEEGMNFRKYLNIVINYELESLRNKKGSSSTSDTFDDVKAVYTSDELNEMLSEHEIIMQLKNEEIDKDLLIYITLFEDFFFLIKEEKQDNGDFFYSELYREEAKDSDDNDEDGVLKEQLEGLIKMAQSIYQHKITNKKLKGDDNTKLETDEDGVLKSGNSFIDGLRKKWSQENTNPADSKPEDKKEDITPETKEKYYKEVSSNFESVVLEVLDGNFYVDIEFAYRPENRPDKTLSYTDIYDEEKIIASYDIELNEGSLSVEIIEYNGDCIIFSKNKAFEDDDTEVTKALYKCKKAEEAIGVAEVLLDAIERYMSDNGDL